MRIVMVDCGTSAACVPWTTGTQTDYYHADRQGNGLAVTRRGADTLVQRYFYTPFGVEMVGDPTGNLRRPLSPLRAGPPQSAIPAGTTTRKPAFITTAPAITTPTAAASSPSTPSAMRTSGTFMPMSGIIPSMRRIRRGSSRSF